MSALDDVTAPPFGSPDEPPPDLPPDPLAVCGYAGWCVKPAGHPGPHKKDPATKARNNRKRSRSKSPGRASSSAGSPAGADSPLPSVLALAWGGLGKAVEAAAPEPAGPPVGRVMQFQSIDAGYILHRALMTVPAYKRINTIAGGGSGALDELAPLLMAPLLAGVMASNETVRLLMWPTFANVIKTSAVSIARVQREQAEAIRQVSEYEAEVEGLLDGMAMGLFAPREEPPEEEAAP
jgi:hypothetical protein